MITDYSLYFSYILLAIFHLFDFDIILKFLLVCRINYGYSLLPSITSINPDCLSGCRVWTYFQPDCSSKPEYSSTVLSFPDDTHIICMSKSFEKWGSAINNLEFSGEDLQMLESILTRTQQV